MHDAFIRLVAKSLKEERFTLVDIGCSGGIESIWRLFGDRFSAIGFDASASECRRLSAEETSPTVSYVAGFAGIPPDHPFARHAAGAPTHSRDIWDRASANWILNLRSKELAAASDREKMQQNVWMRTELADSEKVLCVPDVLRDAGLTSPDFLKIDIDGPDFQVLNSFDGLFSKLGLLATRLEVCLYGDAEDTTNTFHNTDRFMRRQGYALTRLDTRPYAMRALPSRFAITAPAQTVSGRIYQGDAFYALDPVGSPDLASTLSIEKIAKLAAIFSAWEQPDSAAEILLTFRKRLSELFDVDVGLDMLAAQTQYADGEKDEVEILSYRDYMALFEADSPEFYPPAFEPITEPSLWARLGAAFEVLKNWGYVHKINKDRARWRRLDKLRKARKIREAAASRR